jgi:hypothetical protein
MGRLVRWRASGAPFSDSAEDKSCKAIRAAQVRGPSVTSQVITVAVNGRVVDSWPMRKEMHSDHSERDIALPGHLPANTPVDIAFSISAPRNPTLEPWSAETRRLGLGLMAITLWESHEDPP